MLNVKDKLMFVLALSIFFAGVAFAEEDYFSMSLDDLLKTQVTVASTRSTRMIDTVSIVAVIDRKMINDYGFLSVSEALQTVSGFEVYRTYLKRNMPTGRGVLQDHYANKVLVMINGVPSWNAVTGEGNIDRIDIRSVERIEVLKGPASVLYGSQAYSGAINIVLRKPEVTGQRGTVHVGGGNNGAYAAGGHWLLKSDENISLAVALNLREEHGDSFNFTDELGITDSVRDYVSSKDVTIDFVFGEHNLLLNAFAVDESYLGVVPRHISGAGNNHDVDGVLVSYTWMHDWCATAMSDFQLSYDAHERNLSRAADDTVRANILGRRYVASLKNNLDLSKDISLEFGADYDYRKSEEYSNYESGVLIADNNLKDKHMYEYSGFLQGAYDIDDWTFLVGTRHTENELFGENTSSRATVLRRLSEDSSVKLIFGQSFRAPNLFELYFMTPGKTVFGADNLSPEKSTSGELSYQTVVGDCYIQAVAYRSEYDDVIFRTIGSVTLDSGVVYDDVNVYANGSKFHVNGTELEIKYILPRNMNLFLNVDHVYDEDRSSGGAGNHAEFIHIPDFTSTFGLQKSLGKFSASVLLHYIDGIKGHVADVDSSTTLDLSFAYSAKTGAMPTRHSLAVRNLFDEDIAFPEYVRGKGLYEVPLESGVSLFYTFEIEL